MGNMKKYEGIDISEHIDPDVLCRNSAINVEKAMGIYPNIRGLE